MIRLTLKTATDSEIHLFNQTTILIGSQKENVDLALSGPHIQACHLKIIEQNGCFILINQTNDPFVSINGHPFGKKTLTSGDLIKIHEHLLLFEKLSPTLENSPTLKISPESSPSNENSFKESDSLPIERDFLTPLSLPLEAGIELLREEEFQQINWEKYFKEDSSPSDPQEPTPIDLPEEKRDIKEKTSLKDDYLKDLEDENQKKEETPFGQAAEINSLYQAWKWILLFIFSLFIISGAVGTIIYFSISDKTEAQETKAAQGVADIAMALTHAKLNQLKPHNHNWSDVDFLKNNLQAILPDTPSYASHIDAQGQFNSCPYSLRIYTSSDLSHFLLIAQPAPVLLNWLIPPSLIVVDSHAMELRILKDVRNLNRLLANPDPLDGVSGKEITSLIKQGELIDLCNLASEADHTDFAPPKNLESIRPGAQNLIYNAPRYYRLTYPLIQKSIMLSTSKGSSQEVSALKQDVENFACFNPLVIYSDQGKKSAILAKQSMTMFAPSDKILFGYMLFNAQGKVHQVYLLEKEETASHSQQESSDLIAFENLLNETGKEEETPENPLIDVNHPVYIQLQSLVSHRESELTPLFVALSNLMKEELHIPRAQFQIEFQNLSHAYLMANAKHKQTIKESLDSLYHQYKDIPLPEFLRFVKALNLELLIQQDEQSISTIDENCQKNIDLLWHHIEKSRSLNELDNLVDIANTWLNFDYLKDSNQLLKYQNLLRNCVLEQLEKYLLSNKKYLLVKKDDREILEHLLSQERLIKPEEKEFFLNEFEELTLTKENDSLKKL